MIPFQKNVGETSLEALERARMEHGLDPDLPMTYAGTLDPMADGLLLLLVGEECKEKEKYTSLSKEYEVEILFGVSTDTDDVLGLIQNVGSETVARTTVDSALQTFIGKKMEQYHPFSHKKVHGTPLFEHAKAGTINNIEVPEKEIEIFSIEVINETKFEKNEVENQTISNLSKVRGEFRQKEIIEGWQNLFSKTKQLNFQTFKIQVTCSSGTYIRTLVRNISNLLNVPALAIKITRTRIGDF